MFFLPQTLNKSSCMEVPSKMDNVQRKEQGLHNFNTDLGQKKIKLKSRSFLCEEYYPPVERRRIFSHLISGGLLCLWSLL